MQLNNQPTEKQQIREEGILDIVSIWKTLQGEGPFAGTPAVFVRLAGCNLSSFCTLCDTDYTSNRRLISVANLVGEVIEKSDGPGLVVITGGEPLRQDIAPLMDRLTQLNYHVQIETNGTLWLETLANTILLPHRITYVCSPKTGSINEKLKPYIQHLKYIVAHGKVDTEDGLPTDSLGSGVRVARPWSGFKGTVWVQPLDSGNAQENSLHTTEAVRACLKFGYRLCLQLHKIVGLD